MRVGGAGQALASAYFDCLRVNLVHLVRFVQRHLKVDVFSVEVGGVVLVLFELTWLANLAS